MAELYWLKRPIAHRGLHDGSRGIVENSASAIKAAIGASIAIEVDLQSAAGQMPVVFHDHMLDRLTAERGPVSALDIEMLREIPLRGTGDRILSLPDLLFLVNGYVPLVLEVKSTWTGDGKLETNIERALASYGGPVAVMSFDPHSIAAFREIAPHLPRGLVAGRFADKGHRSRIPPARRFAMRHLLTSAFARPHFIAYDIEALPAAAPLVARNLFGLPLLVWTVRTASQRERAMRYADAMIFEGFVP
ncbi:MAG: glycerophosphodiester phosphodiesterase family protein [Methyloceanibacter sp.]